MFWRPRCFSSFITTFFWYHTKWKTLNEIVFDELISFVSATLWLFQIWLVLGCFLVNMIWNRLQKVCLNSLSLVYKKWYIDHPGMFHEEYIFHKNLNTSCMKISLPCKISRCNKTHVINNNRLIFLKNKIYRNKVSNKARWMASWWRRGMKRLNTTNSFMSTCI